MLTPVSDQQEALLTTDTVGEGDKQHEQPLAYSTKEDFEAGLLSCQHGLLIFALRLNYGSLPDAEDLVQDTLLKAFRFSHSFRPGTNLRAWLNRIMMTTATNHYKKRVRQPVIFSLSEEEGFPLLPEIKDMHGQKHHQGSENEFLASHLDEDVVDALNSLPSFWREVIELYYVHDFSYKEIAEILQVPIGTVMSRLSRARRCLQPHLQLYAQEQGYTSDQAS